LKTIMQEQMFSFIMGYAASQVWSIKYECMSSQYVYLSLGTQLYIWCWSMCCLLFIHYD